MATWFLLHQGHSSLSSKAKLTQSNFSVVTFPHIPLVTPVSDQFSSPRAELYMAVLHAANLFISKIIIHILCLPSTSPAGSKVCPPASTTGRVMAPESFRVCCMTQCKDYHCLQFNCNASFQGSAHTPLDHCQTYSSPE